MAERICYLNGLYIKEREARISILDWGLSEGGVYDLARTYNHIPFKLKLHIARLFRSIRSLPFIQFDLTPEEVYEITLQVLEQNKRCLGPQDDWAILFRITRGIQFVSSSKPTFYIHSVPLPFGCTNEQMARWYTEGAHLVVPSTRQIPPQCLDPKIKHTNRLCNNLAEYEARLIDSEAFTLMLDIHGIASEGARENVFVVKDGALFTPRMTDCLGGITRETVLELARDLGIPGIEKDLTVFDLNNADEMMITRTTLGIVPVSKFNNLLVPKPIPGEVTGKLISAFSQSVNYDVVQRVLSMAQPATVA
jgi:branched-chain amino acid aminotransferase